MRECAKSIYLQWVLMMNFFGIKRHAYALILAFFMSHDAEAASGEEAPTTEQVAAAVLLFVQNSAVMWGTSAACDGKASVIHTGSSMVQETARSADMGPAEIVLLVQRYEDMAKVASNQPCNREIYNDARLGMIPPMTVIIEYAKAKQSLAATEIERRKVDLREKIDAAIAILNNKP